MKVEPHSNMTLTEIIKSKNNEETNDGVHYCGHSGVFCGPEQVQKFCENSILNHNVPKLVLIENKNSYYSNIGIILKYSDNGKDYRSFKNSVQLQGVHIKEETCF